MQVMKGEMMNGNCQLWCKLVMHTIVANGSENKIPFLMAISINNEREPINMSFHVVKNFRLSEVSRWASKKALVF